MRIDKSRRLSSTFYTLILSAIIALTDFAAGQTEPPPTDLVGFSAGLYRVSETESAVAGVPPGGLITIAREGSLQGDVLVDVVVQDGTGVNGTDWAITGWPAGSPVTNTVTLGEFQISTNILVAITDNTMTNAPLTVMFSLENARLADPAMAPGVTVGLNTQAAATLEILDNEEGFNFERAHYVVTEDGGEVVLGVTLSVGGPDGVFVDYQTIDAGFQLTALSIEATEDADYQGTQGQLTFPPGEVRQEIRIPILPDALVEFNEDFQVVLMGASSMVTNQVLVTNVVDGVEQVSTNEVPGVVPVLGQNSVATVTIEDLGGQIAGAALDTFNPTTPNVLAPGANNAVEAIALQPDGRVLIGGRFTSVNAQIRRRIARLNPMGTTNGVVDLAFDPGLGADGPVSAIAIDSIQSADFQILIGGAFRSYNSISRNFLARLNQDGSLDPDFATGLAADGPVFEIKSVGDGTIMIGGDFSSYDGVSRRAIARLLSDGSVDPSFDPGLGADGAVHAIIPIGLSSLTMGMTNNGSLPAEGISTVQGTGQAGTVDLTYNFLSDPDSVRVYDGQALVYDSGLIDTFLVATNQDGTLTTNFPPVTVTFPYGPQGSGSLGFVVNEGDTATNGTWEVSAVITPAGASGYVVAGDFVTFNGQSQMYVTRLNADGSVDGSFISGVGPDGPVYGAAVDSQGRWALGGAFSAVNGFTRPGIARLTPDGAVDVAFDPGEGVDGVILDLAVQPDDRILIGGAFNNYNRTQRRSVARVMPDGGVDTTFLDTAYNPSAGLVGQGGLVSAVSLQPDGSVMIGGLFNEVGGGANPLRQRNLALLQGGETEGPGQFGFLADRFLADELAAIGAVEYSRTNGLLGTIEATVSTEDSAATAGEDYEGKSSEPVLWPGSDAVSPTTDVTFYADDLVEGNESFWLRIDDLKGYVDLGGVRVPTGPAWGRVSTEIVIIDDDFGEVSEIAFRELEFIVDENVAMAVITIDRLGGWNTPVAVDYAVEALPDPGSAEPGADFLPRQGVLFFSIQETSKTVNVPIIDDSRPEFDESFVVRLRNPKGGAVISQSEAKVTIVDNDFEKGRVSFVSTDFAASEGEEFAVISVARTGGNAGVLQVDYETVADSASAAFDYLDVFGRLEWNDGEAGPKTFRVPLREDGLVEGAESVLLRLVNPSVEGALGSRPEARLTITDNDAYGALSFDSGVYVVDGDAGFATVVVTRRNGSAEFVSARYRTTAEGTAVAGEDYVETTGTLEFGVGELSKSLEIPLVNNTFEEEERTLVLELFEPVRAELGAVTKTTVRILNEEMVNEPAGSVDTDFRIGLGANGPIYAVQVDKRGGLIVGGAFTQFNQAAWQRMVSLNPNGSISTAFNSDVRFNAPVRALHVQGDGRLLAGGEFTNVNGFNQNHLARLFADGGLDTSFSAGAGADNTVFTVAEIQGASEPKIVVGGSFTTFAGAARPHLARLNSDGSLDQTFDAGTGPNGAVYDAVPLFDGKLLIVGDFTSVNGIERVRVARLNPNGSVDSTFNPGLGVDGSIRAALEQPDGRVVIGGLFSSVNGVERRGVARLNRDGSVDLTFDSAVGANGAVLDMAIQPDGLLVVAGSFTAYAGVERGGIARLTSSGEIDSRINFGSGANGSIAAVTIQPDRKIVVGGEFTSFNGVSRNRIARVHGGALAGSGAFEFAAPLHVTEESMAPVIVTVRRTGGTSGRATVEYRSVGGTATAGEDYVEANGTLVFESGETTKAFPIELINDAIAEGDETIKLELLNPAPEGETALGRQYVTEVRIVSDDSVVEFSEANFAVNEGALAQRAIIRVRRSGMSSGQVIVQATASSQTATAGLDFTAVSEILTFNPGEVEKTFVVPIIPDQLVEGNETVALTLNALSGNALLGLRQATLTIVDDDSAPGELQFQGGPFAFVESGQSATITVRRINGTSGTVSVDFLTEDGTAIAGEDYGVSSGTLVFGDGETIKTITAPIVNDNVVEEGEFFFVTLFNPAGGASIVAPATVTVTITDDDFGPGSVDLSFDPQSGANAPVHSVKIAPNRNIFIGGEFTTFGGQGRLRLARLSPTGQVTPGFMENGGPDRAVFSIDRQFDGKVLAGGGFNSVDGRVRNRVARFLLDGSLDPEFNLPLGVNDAVDVVKAQADGKVFIGGRFTMVSAADQMHLARLNSSGNVDTTFAVGAGANAPVRDIVIYPDGRLLVAGDFTTINGASRSGIARLNGDGTVDHSFNPNGGANGAILAALIQPDGKIVVGGDFTEFAGSAADRIVRLESNGRLDSAFRPGSGADGAVRALALQANGKIILGGDFFLVNDTIQVRIARLNADGTVDTTFTTLDGANGPIYDLAIQDDGKIVVAGGFSSFGGLPRQGIVRLHGDFVTAPEEVMIGGIEIAAGTGVVVRFTGQTGVLYGLEVSDDLNSRQWRVVDTVAGSGGEQQLTDPEGVRQWRFYRIREGQ